MKLSAEISHWQKLGDSVTDGKGALSVSWWLRELMVALSWAVLTIRRSL